MPVDTLLFVTLVVHHAELVTIKSKTLVHVLYTLFIKLLYFQPDM